MRLLSLDISTSLGWALGETGSQSVCPSPSFDLKSYGIITLPKPIQAFGDFPYSYLLAAQCMADQVKELIQKTNPEIIVIEQTNLGKNRYSQKILEYTHCLILQNTYQWFPNVRVVFIDSSSWRKALGIRLSKDQKKLNATLSKAKRESQKTGSKLDKKALGIAGKITQKHLAIQYVRDRFGLDLKQKDDDIADAICILCGYGASAIVCDGER